MITRSKQQFHGVCEFMRGGKKHAKLTELSSRLPERARRFTLCTLIPGASIGYHVHNNECELTYFLEGYGRVQDDDAFHDIGPGDSMVVFSGHGHAIENTGDRDLIYVTAVIRE